MPSFEVTPEVIAEISKRLNIPEDRVRNLHTFWLKSVKTIEQQYLAHVVRAMEQELRKLPGHDFFKIEFVQIAGAAGRRPWAHYQKGQYFAIYFCQNRDEKQLRIELAHELGHLFLVEFFNSKGEDLSKDTELEPASSIMGIFTILEKNEFYQNRTPGFLHETVNEVLQDFEALHNKWKKRK